ncbi:MAG: hypothetical protein U1E53_18480 [Dongiaceae bacterium]
MQARRRLRILVPAALFLALTALTQIGGIAWLLGCATARLPGLRRRPAPVRIAAGLLCGVLLYAALTLAVVPPLAAAMGRARLPCGSDGGALVAATPLNCALNRSYVRPAVLALLEALAAEAARRFPGSRLTVLEGSFPFVDGFPMLPHLSHRDGRKVDLAYFYRDAADGHAIPGGSPSPLGYFVYERPGPGETPSCAGRWTPLRWDLPWLQPDPPRWVIDPERTAWMVGWLTARPEVTRLFIEPYLAQRLAVTGGKVRFQGCRAARHDDHLHIEVMGPGGGRADLALRRAQDGLERGAHALRLVLERVEGRGLRDLGGMGSKEVLRVLAPQTGTPPSAVRRAT